MITLLATTSLLYKGSYGDSCVTEYQYFSRTETQADENCPVVVNRHKSCIESSDYGETTRTHFFCKTRMRPDRPCSDVFGFELFTRWLEKLLT
jgi:hypothetical protein